MDLLSISRTVWRHKLATIPVFLIMLIGVAYVLVLKKPMYQAQSSYVLLPAPTAPPTKAQIAQDPSLKRVQPNNPFTGYGDLSVVVDLLTEVMSSPAESQVLASQGVAGTYTVAPLATAYGNAPIVQITTEGPSAAAAVASARLVGKAFQTQLADIQAAKGTSKLYWIGSMQLSRPDQAQQQVSSKLRELVAVIAVGLILLFAVVSTMNALEERRRERLAAHTALAEDDVLGPDEATGDLGPDAAGLPHPADLGRARAARSVSAGRQPGGQVVDLGEERTQTYPWDFDAQLEHASVPPRGREDR